LIFYQVPIENKQEFKWGIKVKTYKKYPDLRLYGVLWVKSIQFRPIIHQLKINLSMKGRLTFLSQWFFQYSRQDLISAHP